MSMIVATCASFSSVTDIISWNNLCCGYLQLSQKWNCQSCKNNNWFYSHFLTVMFLYHFESSFSILRK